MTTHPKLSALVVAHNEERHLPECLKTLAFADEIVVVLDKCTDQSGHIASHYTRHLIDGAWDVEGERRNVGLSHCSGDWVLEIDADERVPAELAREIREVMNTGKADHYSIPFDNHIGQTLVKHGWGCYWGVRSAPRLSRRGYKVWGKEVVHPSYELKGQGGGKLTHTITHYVDDDIADMIRRFNRYTESNAKDLIAKGNIGSFGGNIRRIFSRFFKCYVQRQGYKEGMYGFLNALFAGLYPIVSYCKAREMLEKTKYIE